MRNIRSYVDWCTAMEKKEKRAASKIMLALLKHARVSVLFIDGRSTKVGSVQEVNGLEALGLVKRGVAEPITWLEP